MGIEPTTPCLQSRCSSQLSYVPEAPDTLPLAPAASRPIAAHRGIVKPPDTLSTWPVSALAGAEAR